MPVNKENLLKKNNFTKMHCLFIAKLVIVKGKHKKLYNLGLNVGEQEKFAEAEQFYEDALAIFREIGDQEREAKTLYNIACNFGEQGKFAEEKQFFEDALPIYRKIGDREPTSEDTV